MNADELLREIQLKGYQVECYRFDMILPKAFLGKGKKFDCFGGKGIIAPDNASWYREDCLIPMDFVTGVELKKMDKESAVVSFLIVIKDLGKFVKAISDNLTDFDFNVIVEEIKYGNTDTISRET